MLNDGNEPRQKRWGVQPDKISLFTADDFRRGRREGFTIGGGWRWRSANVIGSSLKDEEIIDRVITAADRMMGDSRIFRGSPGRGPFQLHVNHLLDQTDIIPSRLAFSATARDGGNLPGGRGLASTRYDPMQPHEFRCTTTDS